MRLSAPELETLRTKPSQTTLSLFVYQPSIVMKCLASAADIAKGEVNIEFDSVSFGTFDDVSDNMTLLIGSAEGLSDIGRIRIRYATADSFVVSENSNIRWRTGLHLTVINYYEVWPVFPRIIANPSAPTSVIFYKDFDIPYVNQNTLLGTFVCMGPNRPALLTNGEVDIYYSSTGTYNLLGESLSYDWQFEGGTPSTSTSSVPGYITYNTAGDYVTKLTVTSTSGVQDVSYRYISVKNRVGEGSNNPIARWTMDSLTGSRDEAGYNLSIKVYDEITIDDNSLVMLLADDWSGSQNVSLGGYKNASNVFFVGYVDSGSISYNYQYGYQSFTVSSITAIMKKLTGFSVSVSSKPSPGTWYELYDMDVRRAIYHYLRWHSTVLPAADFQFVGDDYKLQYFDVDRTSLYDAVNGILSEGLLGSLSADRTSRLWAEVKPSAYLNPTGTFHPVMDITRRDWMSEPKIQSKINDTTSYMEVGGIAYSGVATGTYGAFLSGAPGSTPSFAGGIETVQGLIVTGQEHLNILSGHLWANKNQEYPSIGMDSFATPLRNLDIAPYESVSIHINPEDTTKAVEIDGLYMPNSFTWNYDPQKGTLFAGADFTGLVNGVPGDTIIIPITSDEEIEFDNDYNFSIPPFTLPLLTDLIIVDPTSVENVFLAIKNRGIFYTNDFTSDYPTWYESNFGLPEVENIYQFEVSNTGKMYVQLGQYGVYGADAPGGGWGIIFTADMVGNPEDYPFPRDQRIMGFGIDRNSDDDLIILAGVVVSIFSTDLIYAWRGSMGGVALASPEFLTGSDLTAVSYGYITKGITDNVWTVTFSEGGIKSAQVTNDGSGLSNKVFTGSSEFYHTRSKKANNTFLSNSFLYGSFDGANTWSKVSGTTSVLSDSRFQSYIADETGQQMLVGNGTSMGLSYTNDFGATWTNANHTGTISAVWHLGEDNYIVSGESEVFSLSGLYSGASGTMLTNKTGNLQELITGSFDTMVIRSY